MKFRMGFVTNSSSYSSLVITVRSKELMKVLNSYNVSGEGLFVSEEVFDYSDYESGFPMDISEESKSSFVDAFFDLLEDLLGWGIDIDGEVEDVMTDLNKSKSKIIEDISFVRYDYTNQITGSEIYGNYDNSDLKAMIKKSNQEKTLDDIDSIEINTEYDFVIIDGKPKSRLIEKEELHFLDSNDSPSEDYEETEDDIEENSTYLELKRKIEEAENREVDDDFDPFDFFEE